jgi:ATP adenylyltransferase
MESAALFAPWRMEYIRSLEKPKDDGCFICAAAAASTDEQRRQRLVLWSTPHSIVLMNRFPYAYGHLLVAPRLHKADLEELNADEHLDLSQQVTHATRLLRRAVSAQGFNLGVNLGRCAGAGVPGHLHHHVVPRWAGDVNFMAVVGEVRIIPEAISQLYEELMRVRSLEKIAENHESPRIDTNLHE